MDTLRVRTDGLRADGDEDRERKRRRRLTYGVWTRCMRTQMAVIGVGRGGVGDAGGRG